MDEARLLAAHDLDRKIAGKGQRRAIRYDRHGRILYADTASRLPARMTFCLNSW